MIDWLLREARRDWATTWLRGRVGEREACFKVTLPEHMPWSARKSLAARWNADPALLHPAEAFPRLGGIELVPRQSPPHADGYRAEASAPNASHVVLLVGHARPCWRDRLRAATARAALRALGHPTPNDVAEAAYWRGEVVMATPQDPATADTGWIGNIWGDVWQVLREGERRDHEADRGP